MRHSLVLVNDVVDLLKTNTNFRSINYDDTVGVIRIFASRMDFFFCTHLNFLTSDMHLKLGKNSGSMAR